MKVPLAVLLVLFGGAVVVFGLPAPTTEKSDPSKDAELLPPNTYGGQPIVDTGFVDTGFGWSPPISNPFGGLFENIESIMARMRQQMEEVFKRFPYVRNSNGTDLAFGGFPDDIDPSKVNTTSVTKIINGHKVVINDTEYKNTNENGGSLYHVRVIDVQPNDSASTSSKEVPVSKPTPPVVKDIESVENSISNEIVKGKEYVNREKRYAKLETFDEGSYIEPFVDDVDNHIEVIGRGWNEPISVRFVDYPQPWFPFGGRFPQNNVDLQSRYPQSPVHQTMLPQLSYVQNRWPQSNYPFERIPQREYYQNRYPQSNYPLNGFSQTNNFQNKPPQISFPQNIPASMNFPQNRPTTWSLPQNRPTATTLSQNRPASLSLPPNRPSQGTYPQTAFPPIDLSRDTYVNDILAQSGAPTNPDAEVFDVNSLPSQSPNRFRYPR